MLAYWLFLFLLPGISFVALNTTGKIPQGMAIQWNTNALHRFGVQREHTGPQVEIHEEGVKKMQGSS